MARTAGKKQAPAKIEEDDDTEGWDDAVVETEESETEQNLRLRDWRDVERFREMKELRRLVDDDYGLEEIFHIPVKPRAEPGIPAPHNAIKLPRPLARGAAAPAPQAKPAKGQARPAKGHVKPARPGKAAATPARDQARPVARKAPARPAAASTRPKALKAKAKRR